MLLDDFCLTLGCAIYYLQVTVHFNTGVVDAFGDNVLEGLHLVDNATGEKRDLKVNGLFYGIGHQPNSKLVAGQIDLDEAGYVKVGGS
jgi:thioredoxin reductase (NADPH)